MQPQQVFEGPDLARLLDRVAAEAGPSARVSGVTRVRKGGIAGFFAKEHFEVKVELAVSPASPTSGGLAAALTLPDAPGRSAGEPEAPQPHLQDGEPGSVGWTGAALSLLEAEDSAGGRHPGGPSSPPPPAALSAPAGPPVPSPQAVAAAPAAASTENRFSPSTPALAEHRPHVAGDASGAPAWEGSGPVPETRAFAAYLQAASAYGRRGGEASTGTDLRPVMRPPGAASESVADVPGSGQATPADGRYASSDTRVSSAAGSPGACRRAESPRPTDREVLSSRCVDTHDHGGGDAGADPERGLEEILVPLTAPAPSQGAPGRDRFANDGPLAALGLPGWLRPTELGGKRLGEALTASLAALPSPPRPPAGPGQVTVLAGPLHLCLPAARRIAEDAGISPAGVVLASSGDDFSSHCTQVRSIAAVKRRMREWREAREPVFVALATPVGTRGLAWATSILIALQPDAVWGVVSATTKGADCTEWAKRLGVEAVVVEEADASGSPATVLEMGIPVATVDGRPATAELWAALLVEKLVRRPA